MTESSRSTLQAVMNDFVKSHLILLVVANDFSTPGTYDFNDYDLYWNESNKKKFDCIL